MDIDLYTFASFIVGVLTGCLAGIWLSGLISAHKVERIEQKVHALSDNKFKLKGQRVRLKQLEQRLDEEAASIPLAERELQEKSGEIRELTTALNETTALTSELAQALRSRKIKVQQLQVEQAKWMKRNKALLLKTENVENNVAGMKEQLAMQRSTNEELDSQNTPQTLSSELATDVAEASNGQAIPATAAFATSQLLDTEDQNGTAEAAADGTVDRLNSRMQEMESELQYWLDRVGKLEANVSGQQNQASGLALLEEVLRGEADNQDAAASSEQPQLLGGQSAS